MFSKSFVALITPFQDNAFDQETFEKIVNWHIEQGTHGLVPCGTTGETPVLELSEYAQVIQSCVKTANGRVPVIAGAGANATDKAITLAKTAEDNGADALLIVSPYYNKPTQDGIIAHYDAIHSATNLPIVLYNVPSRTGGDIAIDTVIHLGQNYERIVGIKDASPDLTRPVFIRRALGADFCLLYGEDATVGAYLGQGGDGCISVSANVAPGITAAMHNAWAERDFDTFARHRDFLMPLHNVLFYESSPTPTKYALSRMGFGDGTLRLPLLPASTECRLLVDTVLDDLDLLSSKAA